MISRSQIQSCPDGYAPPCNMGTHNMGSVPNFMKIHVTKISFKVVQDFKTDELCIEMMTWPSSTKNSYQCASKSKKRDGVLEENVQCTDLLRIGWRKTIFWSTQIWLAKSLTKFYSKITPNRLQRQGCSKPSLNHMLGFFGISDLCHPCHYSVFPKKVHK